MGTAGAWLDQGFDVIAHGPFFDRDEDQALLHAIPGGVTPRRVLLHTTFDVALERVRADPERMLSRYPDVLKATYDRVDELLPQMPPSEWAFETTATDVATIIDELAASLLHRGHGHSEHHGSSGPSPLPGVGGHPLRPNPADVPGQRRWHANGRASFRCRLSDSP